MKKVLFNTILAAAAALAAACTVEPVSVEVTPANGINSNIPTEIICEIDQEGTKVQYESNTTFGWTNGDQVRMPVVKRTAGTITACDMFTFSTSSASGSTSATFLKGVSDDMETFDPNPGLADGTWTNMGYLVYPHSIFNKENSGDYPVVNLPANITYSSSTPLDGGVVPMIGRKIGETYKFKTAVGIIKVTLTNAPSDGKKIRLTSSDAKIAGKFAVSDVDANTAQIASSSAIAGTNELTLTGLSLTGGESYDFYFPVPVGTYAAGTLTLSILDNENMPLMEKGIGKSLTIDRNVVLALPNLAYHRVYVKGSVTNPLLCTVNPSTTIRTHIASTKLTAGNYNSEEWVNGNKFGGNQSGWDLTGLKNTSSVAYLSASGDYYLQYIVCSSDAKPASLSAGNVVVYGSVPFKFRTSGDASMSNPSSVIGTYSVKARCGWHGIEESTMVIEASDDGEKGNIMITSILGQATKLYGTFASAVITISEDQVWYVDGSSATHRLCNSWNGTYDSTWLLKPAASNDLDLILGSSYVVNQWFTESNGTDHYYNSFDCSK